MLTAVPALPRPLAVTTGPTILRSVIPKRSQSQSTFQQSGPSSPGASVHAQVSTHIAPASPTPSCDEIEFLLPEDLMFVDPEDEPISGASLVSEPDADAGPLAFGLDIPPSALAAHEDDYRTPPPCPRLSYHAKMDSPAYVASSSSSPSISHLYSPFAAGYSFGASPSSVRSSYFDYRSPTAAVDVFASSYESTASCFQGTLGSTPYWRDRPQRPSFASYLSSASEGLSSVRPSRENSISVDTASTVSSAEWTGTWPFEQQRRRSNVAERRSCADKRASYDRRVSISSAMGRVSCR